MKPDVEFINGQSHNISYCRAIWARKLTEPDIVLGIVGAIVGGFLFNQFGAAGVTGFNIYSMYAVTGRRAVR
jgi:hypothetical protein